LAISYLERFDLAHVDPSEGSFDALGKGEAEGRPAPTLVSKGLTRSRADKLSVVSGGSPTSAIGSGGSNVTAISGAATARAEGATARKSEPEAKLSPAQALEQLAWQQPSPTTADRRAEAKAKGYEGEMCGECGNFTLVRNGTCMKCDTCGSTTGCS
jgi:ribonucleoside-diphosphate reductase alpha chain